MCGYMHYMCMMLQVLLSLCRLLMRGYRHPLEESDLWSLNPADQSQAIVPQLVRSWHHECSKAKRSEVTGLSRH